MIVLEVPATLEYRDVATRVVSAACRFAVPSQDTVARRVFRDEVVSAFGEAFNNIALHAYRGLPPGSLRIEVVPSDEGISIRLVDRGKSFDPATIPEPTLADLPESGLGVFIIRSFMDEVIYEPGQPNVLTLIKRIGMVDVDANVSERKS